MFIYVGSYLLCRRHEHELGFFNVASGEKCNSNWHKHKGNLNNLEVSLAAGEAWSRDKDEVLRYLVSFCLFTLPFMVQF